MNESKHISRAWHETSTGNHQGLIIDEETGKNIAVCYDKADAPLIAAAPKLLVVSHNLAKAMGIDYAIKKLSTLSDDTMALGAATILAGIQRQAKIVTAEVEKGE